MMRISDEEDRLLDILLDEMLGKDAPPDVLDRVLARSTSTRDRVVRLGASVLAAAVVVLAVAFGHMATRRTYPQPVLASGDTLSRGSTVTTEAEPESLLLGGYCSVTAMQHSSLRIEGEESAEGIFLERGEVLCDVDPSVGTFCVRTEAGKVSVTGTKFRVAAARVEDAEMKMLVKVLVGSVVVLGLQGQEFALSAEGDDEIALGAGGEQEVALDKIPQEVKAAALKAVPGIVLKEAEKITKDAAVIYEIDGTANGKEYEIIVLSTGKVLSVKIEEEDGDDDDGDVEDEDDDDVDNEDDADEIDDDEDDGDAVDDDDDDDNDNDDDDDDDADEEDDDEAGAEA